MKSMVGPRTEEPAAAEPYVAAAELYVAAAEPHVYVTWWKKGAKERVRKGRGNEGAYEGMGRAWFVSVASYVGLFGSTERCVCLWACECGPVGPYMRVVGFVHGGMEGEYEWSVVCGITAVEWIVRVACRVP